MIHRIASLIIARFCVAESWQSINLKSDFLDCFARICDSHRNDEMGRESHTPEQIVYGFGLPVYLNVYFTVNGSNHLPTPVSLSTCRPKPCFSGLSIA